MTTEDHAAIDRLEECGLDWSINRQREWQHIGEKVTYIDIVEVTAGNGRAMANNLLDAIFAATDMHKSKVAEVRAKAAEFAKDHNVRVIGFSDDGRHEATVEMDGAEMCERDFVTACGSAGLMWWDVLREAGKSS